jgi:hypothetical protein
MGEWMYSSTHSWPRHQLEVSGQTDATFRFPHGERTLGTRWIGGWVGPINVLDYVERGTFCLFLYLNSYLSAVEPVASRYAVTTLSYKTVARCNSRNKRFVSKIANEIGIYGHRFNQPVARQQLCEHGPTRNSG